MTLDQMSNTLAHLNVALKTLNDDYQATGDKTMRFDVVTLKVVISNMEKRRSNEMELNRRNLQP